MWPSLTVRSLGLLFIVTVLFKFALSGWTPLQHHDWQVTTVPKVPGMVYTCVTSCKTNFSTAGGLNRHQNSCAVYKTAQALKIEQRRAGKQKVRPKDKLDVRKARIQDAQAHQHVVEHGSGSSGIVSTPVLMDFAVDPHRRPIPAGAAMVCGPLDSESGSRKSTATLPPSTQSELPKIHIVRSRILPQIQDPIPEVPTIVQRVPQAVRRVILHVRDSFRTGLNCFSVLREYLHRPSYDADAYVKPQDLANFQIDPPSSPNLLCQPPEEATSSPPPPWPFENMSKYLLMNWCHSGSTQKSEKEVNRLAQDVICNPAFKLEDLVGFNVRKENQQLDKARVATGRTPFSDDDWQEVSVEIEVPTQLKTSIPSSFQVPGLHHRSIIQIIKATWGAVTSQQFHLTPFRRIHVHPETGEESRIYDELYTSDAFEAEYDKLQKQPPEPGCKLEKVIAGLMFWSDSTSLADFGNATAWPIYMYFGNLSKYIRAKPTSGACHHLAFIPSIPGSFHDFLTTLGLKPTQRSNVLTQCRRELMHQVWRILLDDEFLEAYRHGVVLRCTDGVMRRVYPRIFTYSADYKEKVLLAAIRDNGQCLCPRCLVSKAEIDKMGYACDIANQFTKARTFLGDLIRNARRLIYHLGYSITSTRVEGLLQSFSLTPTVNVFAEKLGPFGFDPYSMLVVDIMHEFELGIWKSTFIHILRVLYAAAPGGQAINELNARFRQIPSFGRGIIRHFSNNVSERKKLVARHYEDLLQDIIPVVEGLLPEPHNTRLLTLLYRLAEWHALAKLRMHTESTICHLEKATKNIAHELHSFRDFTRESFKCWELPREIAARACRKQKKDEKVFKDGPGIVDATKQKQAASKHRKVKVLNLATYKFHALGDYVEAIRRFGTTDSYSTQIGELAHRTVKCFYRMTNKINAARQIARRERRSTHLQRAQEAAMAPRRRGHIHHLQFSDNDPLPRTGMEQHHQISDSKNYPLNLFTFVNSPPNDPAKKDFIPKLKTHLLGRLLGEAFDGDEPRFSGEARNSVRIIGNKIYSAKVLRINYTTYDMRRDQDSMNPRTSCDVMVISPEKQCGAHPYWYARVLGVFHAQVLHTGPEARNRSVQHMEFLWVHWFGVEPNYQTGSRMARLPKIGFVPDTDESAFGFLDPSLVLRGCHLVPAFAHGRTQDLLRMTSLTAARQPEETDEWVNYYVIIWVDWDMFMRYLGGGIGHLSQPQRSPDVDSKDGQVGMDVDHDSSAAAEENPIIETPLQDLQKLGVNSAGAGSSCGSSRSSDDGSSEADGSDIDSCLDSDPSATTEWDSEDKEDEDGSDLGFEDDESDGDGAEDTSW